MAWLAWLIGLVLVVAVSIGHMFLQGGLPTQERRGSRIAHVKRRRLSPSRWML
jgi:hypothetical protein